MKANMEEKLTTTEFMFAWLGFLSTREEVTTISQDHDISDVLNLAVEFLKVNGLYEECRKDFNTRIKYPNGE
jgi:hypothetical protein